MTTEEIINDMRSHTITSMRAAADRLEQLQRELKQAIAERTPHDYALLNDQIKYLKEQMVYMQQGLSYEIADGKKARDEVDALKKELAETIRERNETVADLIEQRDRALASARPDPSRLEIAAMLKAGWFANRDAESNAIDNKWWVKQADALIAAAKEAK